MYRIITVALLACLAVPASAQSIFGSGGLACRNWTTNKPRKWPHLADVDWLMGYVSGINQSRGAGSRLLGEATRADAVRFVTEYCAANPDVAIFEGADAWLKAIEAPR
jgi:hypothetical protein